MHVECHKRKMSLFWNKLSAGNRAFLSAVSFRKSLFLVFFLSKVIMSGACLMSKMLKYLKQIRFSAILHNPYIMTVNVIIICKSFFEYSYTMFSLLLTFSFCVIIKSKLQKNVDWSLCFCSGELTNNVPYLCLSYVTLLKAPTFLSSELIFTSKTQRAQIFKKRTQ